MTAIQNVELKIDQAVAAAVEAKRSAVGGGGGTDAQATLPTVAAPIAPLLLQSSFSEDALKTVIREEQGKATEQQERLAAADTDPTTGLVVTAETEWAPIAAERDQAWCHLAQLSSVRVAGLQARCTALAESIHNDAGVLGAPPAIPAPPTPPTGADVPPATAAAWKTAEGIAARLAEAEKNHHATASVKLEECLSELDAANATYETAANMHRRRAVGEQLLVGFQATHERLVGVNKSVKAAKRTLFDLLELDDDDGAEEEDLAEDEDDEPEIRKAKKEYAKHTSAKTALLREREQWLNDIVMLSEKVSAELSDDLVLNEAPAYDFPDLPARARQTIRPLRRRKGNLSGRPLQLHHMLCLLERNQVSLLAFICNKGV